MSAFDTDPMADDAPDPLLDRVARAIAADGAPREGDRELIAGAAAQATRAAPLIVRLTPARRVPRWLLPAAALLMLAGGLASAATWLASPASPPPKAIATIPPEGPPESPTATAPHAPTETASQAPPPTVNVTELPSVATPSPKPSATAASAATLFAQANEARRSGDPAAATLYRNLETQFPHSSEAHVANVALGRLYLDRTGDASNALAQFDAYLAVHGGALDEEALVGRALSLQQLGRTGEERSAWEKLLAAHPDSMSAERARQRLRELP
jgi:TolA-binding protein